MHSFPDSLSIIPVSWDLNHSVHYVFRLLGMVDSFLTFGVACVVCEIPFILDYGIVPPEFCLYLLLQANQNYQQSGTHFLWRLLAWEFSRLLDSINLNWNLYATLGPEFWFLRGEFWNLSPCRDRRVLLLSFWASGQVFS